MAVPVAPHLVLDSSSARILSSPGSRHGCVFVFSYYWPSIWLISVREVLPKYLKRIHGFII